MNAEIIRALERHRIAQMAHPEKRAELDESTINLLILNDNLLEGVSYQLPDIQLAQACDLEKVEPYQIPQFKRIRAYRELIIRLQHEAYQGVSAITLENLKAIHQAITSDAKEPSEQFRPNSPVHRDYSQDICAPDNIPFLLQKLFDDIAENFEEATDPVAYCAQVHHQLMYIYPFRMNPGSTARLFTNLMFLSQGYPPLIISGHQRSEYYDALCQKDAVALTDLFLEAFRQTL